MPSTAPYLRQPSLAGDRLVFVTDDDVWLGSIEEGRAWRLTSDRAAPRWPRLSPDGTWVAYAAAVDGPNDVHLVNTETGERRRLTWTGHRQTVPLGWHPDGRVVVAQTAGEPFRSRSWAWAVPLEGGAGERLPYGPLSALSFGAEGVLVGVDQSTSRGASWKRYRGGTAGKAWIERDGTGRFERIAADLNGQIEDPQWWDGRVALVSDHEGCGNVYSLDRSGGDLRRHTDHQEYYARAAAGDGQRLVYQCGGDLWLLQDPSASSEPRRLELHLESARGRSAPTTVEVPADLRVVAADRAGAGAALQVRGSVVWLPLRDGPARVLEAGGEVRGRCPAVGGTGERTVVAWVTDEAGEDALRVAPVPAPTATPAPAAPAPDAAAPGSSAETPATAKTAKTAENGAAGRSALLAAGALGRVIELAVSPDGRWAAVSSHDNWLRIVDLSGPAGEVRAVRHSDWDYPEGLAWSPDSKWLAWGDAGPGLPFGTSLRQILVTSVDDGAIIEATPMRFRDREPVFTADGRYLAFLSSRTFDPVEDEHVFDLGFPVTTRPYLIPLAAATPSPLGPWIGGRVVAPAPGGEGAAKGAGAGRADDAVTVEADGIQDRVVTLPVPTGRMRGLAAVKDGLVWLSEQPAGDLGDGRAREGGDPVKPRLERYDLTTGKTVTLVDAADAFGSTAEGRALLVRRGDKVQVIPSDRRVDDADDPAVVNVDLERVRLRVDPAAERRQMLAETARLVRDHFWVEDMAGVDWDAAFERYRALVDRVSTRAELSELIWELNGELGSSHAYEWRAPAPTPPGEAQGYLGCDWETGPDGHWVLGRILAGEPSVPTARSPLRAAGVAVAPGDAVVAVNGQPVDPVLGPSPLLAGSAGRSVELTVQPAGDAGSRVVAVVPLGDEGPLRYHEWVAEQRRIVHQATADRVGYVHVPDMQSLGWAELHRDLRQEIKRDALIVDLRDNGGGSVSQLVMEKLSRMTEAWELPRHSAPMTYPSDARRGPMVALINEQAGSDGDIAAAVTRHRRLGPLIGTRTWGGVIGIDGRYTLADGTMVTQPRYAFWFQDDGWSVENYGVDPDIEVPIAPHDWGAGRDPQLETGIGTVLQALEEHPPVTPPSTADRPDRRPPPLPPRPSP